MPPYGFDQQALGTQYGSGSASLYGSGLDEASNYPAPVDVKKPSPYADMAKGGTQAMNAGGTASSALTSAGMMGLMAGTGGAAAPVALAGGLALGMYEQKQKAEAAAERSRVEEAQQRKQDVQAALNQALGATRQLGV